jgi:Fe-S cluster assembly protein SufD
MDETALFYLRSRGIDELSARRLLLVAFASECLDRMKEGPVRVHVEKLVQQHMLRIIEASHSGKHVR